MTSSFALPILLDPRVNNVPLVMGLTLENYDEFVAELHELHFKWYVNAHATRLKKRRLLASHEPPGASQIARPDDVVHVEVDMGWDNFRPNQRDDVAPVSTTETQDYMCTEVPLGRRAFFVKSKKQYNTYLDKCLAFPWAATYPKAQVGKPGVRWQVNLAEEDLRPVMLDLSMKSEDGSLGFFVQLAMHSSASMFKMPASSFVERVNSAGKIVYNERNVKMLPTKVEQRVLLRMNRKWMVHMRTTYPDLTSRLERFSRATHDALNNVYADDGED
jgi:hypothetical protein